MNGFDPKTHRFGMAYTDKLINTLLYPYRIYQGAAWCIKYDIDDPRECVDTSYLIRAPEDDFMTCSVKFACVYPKA